jgi:hypothetical protein
MEFQVFIWKSTPETLKTIEGFKDYLYTTDWEVEAEFEIVELMPYGSYVCGRPCLVLGTKLLSMIEGIDNYPHWIFRPAEELTKTKANKDAREEAVALLNDIARFIKAPPAGPQEPDEEVLAEAYTNVVEADTVVGEAEQVIAETTRQIGLSNLKQLCGYLNDSTLRITKGDLTVEVVPGGRKL